MSKINDEKVLQLKKSIEAKKQKLKNSKKFSPVTNLSMEFEGIRVNFNVLSRGSAIELLIRLNALLLSAKDLKLVEEYTISGYLLTDWISDLKGKLDVLSVKNEENKLKLMESKLDKMLSDDKKTELELAEIEDLLK